MRLHEIRALWMVLAALAPSACFTPSDGDGDETGGTDDADGTADDDTTAGSADSTAGDDVDPSGGEESESETDTPDDIEPLDTPQKGGPVAVNDLGSLLAVANKATDDVSIFALPELTLITRFDVGDEPVSVSFGPDSETLFVVNRGDGTAMKVTGTSTDSPTIATPSSSVVCRVSSTW